LAQAIEIAYDQLSLKAIPNHTGAIAPRLKNGSGFVEELWEGNLIEVPRRMPNLFTLWTKRQAA